MSKIIDVFYENVKKSPNKIAIYCDDKKITYKDLSILVNVFSNLFISNGIKYLDNVGIILPNNIEFIALMLVAAQIGIALVPINPALPSENINNIFKVTDVKHIVGLSSILKSINLNNYYFKLSLDGKVNNCINFLETIKNNKIVEYCKTNGKEPFILTMTSGSTGNPKPIVLTQKNKLDRALAAINLYNISTNDTILAATPLHHSLAERLALIPLLLGATCILMPRFSSVLWLEEIKKHKVTFTIAVSSQLKQVAETLKKHSLPEINSLRCIVSSSSLLETQIKEELVRKLHCDFHECYGTSEIAIATNINISASQNKLQSVGCAIKNVEIKILKDNKTIAKANEPGEIICKTPMLFAGYYKLLDLTKKAMFGNYFCRRNTVGPRRQF